MASVRLSSGKQIAISADRPHQISDAITCEAAGRIQSVRCGFTLRHSDTSDLRVFLQAPGNRVISLMHRRGRGGPGFSAAVFSDDAELSVAEARAPFTSPMRPEASLDSLSGMLARGDWHLIVQDVRARDGGSLDGWWIELELRPDFQIELDALGLTSAQLRIAQSAVDSWSARIVGGLEPAKLPDGRNVRDVLITLRSAEIDGKGTILGYAGPTHVRWQGGLPIAGQITLDREDVAIMEGEGSLRSVIDHEIAHVLGFGTLWQAALVSGLGGPDPRFTGARAKSAYEKLLAPGMKQRALLGVPLEDEGGAGTREVHWRESEFTTELMTGWISGTRQPVSSVTIASFADLGYEINPHAAEYYSLGAKLLDGRKLLTRRKCVVPLTQPIRVK